MDTAFSRRTSLKIGSAMTLLAMAPIRAAAAVSETAVADQRDQPLSLGWRFYRGDDSDYASKSFDDAKWRTVDLPHDWSIEDLEPSDTKVNSTIRQIDTAPLWEAAKNVPKTAGPFDGGRALMGATSRSG